MLTAHTLPLALAALASASTAAAHLSPSHGHAHAHLAARSHHSNRAFFPARPALNSLTRNRKRSARVRRGEPESLMPGTLTSSEGCTQYAHVETGDWCIKVVDAIEGMTLDRFYEINPQIDQDCQNLWAGYDVCVSTTAKANAAKLTTSEAAPATTVAEKTTTAAPVTTTTTEAAAETTVAKPAKVKVVVTTSSSTTTTTTTTVAPKTTTTTTTTTTTSVKAAQTSDAVIAAASHAAASSDASEEYGDEDDDDWVCDDDEDDSTSAAAPASTAQQQWTSSAAPAPTTTTTTTSQWVEPTTTTTTTTTTSQAPAVTKVADTSSANVLAASGIKGFLGENTNAILSWYDTNLGRDDTNGRGWCEWNYNNDIPGFAPSLKTMLSNFNYDAAAAKTAYCGLEAEVTTSDGKTATLYIVDAFDDTWVRTPSSLDIIIGAFEKLWGSSTSNKNDVFTGATWKFTGNRRDDYRYKSPEYQS
ncbi:hypothetical protein JCM11251_003149 [Rhodosporidiobolus azoricus]